MILPRIIVTGASGFVGRHLLDSLKEEYEIVGLGRRSQARCGAPFHPNITWHQVDIGDSVTLDQVFAEIQAGGPVEFVIHLAAHYDFTGEDHPEYYRTNVEGLRNVLEHCRVLKPRRFIFSSSVAACAFPPSGEALTESSPPDGDHIYAKTKAMGEAMLAGYRDDFPSVIVRFAALFSDWCEYPPLYMFLRTWLSRAWNRRILGGRGNSAIPYLHVNDLVSCLVRIIVRNVDLEDGEILLASPDGAVSHEQLFIEATQYFFDHAKPPFHMPRPLIKPGIVVQGIVGRFLDEKPFERPWMARYVDMELGVDASRTRERLNWFPRRRLEILYRLPFLIENFKYDRIEWTRRNRDAMKMVRFRPNLKIHSLMVKNKEDIIEESARTLRQDFPSYGNMSPKDLDWILRMVLRNLFNAVRTRMKTEFMSYCREVASRRIEQGFAPEEIVGALETLDSICIKALIDDPESTEVQPYLYSCITMTIRFGIDQVMETCDRLHEQSGHGGRSPCDRKRD
ncbi:MAG: NAD(P)-dependent oxidoreductase [Candidatus Krumholzibacteriota bacterium]